MVAEANTSLRQCSKFEQVSAEQQRPAGMCSAARYSAEPGIVAGLGIVDFLAGGAFYGRQSAVSVLVVFGPSIHCNERLVYYSCAAVGGMTTPRQARETQRERAREGRGAYRGSGLVQLALDRQSHAGDPPARTFQRGAWGSARRALAHNRLGALLRPAVDVEVDPDRLCRVAARDVDLLEVHLAHQHVRRLGHVQLDVRPAEYGRSLESVPALGSEIVIEDDNHVSGS
eukprot:2890719-Rhodomonas_salina.3